MSYLHKLRDSAKRVGNISCIGIDPDLDKIPFKEKTSGEISRYFSEIFEAMDGEDAYPAAVKTNLGFFEQYGLEGYQALKDIIEICGQYEVPVIFDGKRGDIGKTAAAYAKAAFEYWEADAATVSPYLGKDSIEPFLTYKDKGAYVLVKTSNKSAYEMQDMKVGKEPVFMKTAQLIDSWHAPGLGAVVGATYPEELRRISKYFVSSGKEIPMLIPGVGSQGGDPRTIMAILKDTRNELAIHRINSSSGITYAYLDSDSDDYAGEAVKALLKLNKATKI
jgi:orotidine-5'-phosphate decarboxylase